MGHERCRRVREGRRGKGRQVVSEGCGVVAPGEVWQYRDSFPLCDGAFVDLLIYSNTRVKTGIYRHSEPFPYQAGESATNSLPVVAAVSSDQEVTSPERCKSLVCPDPSMSCEVSIHGD